MKEGWRKLGKKRLKRIDIWVYLMETIQLIFYHLINVSGKMTAEQLYNENKSIRKRSLKPNSYRQRKEMMLLTAGKKTLIMAKLITVRAMNVSVTIMERPPVIIAILAPSMIITTGGWWRGWAYAETDDGIFSQVAEGGEMKMAASSINNTDIRTTQRVLVAVSIMQIATINISSRNNWCNAHNDEIITGRRNQHHILN